MAKLIAGHTQNDESLVGIASVELVHLSVVPVCCSSEWRDVLNEHHFAPQGGEAEHLSGEQLSC